MKYYYNKHPYSNEAQLRVQEWLLKVKLDSDNVSNEDIVRDSKYMDWLCKFSMKYPLFWNKVTNDKFKKLDRDNINNISILYNVVGKWSRIKYRGIGFELGYIDNSDYIYCKRIEIDKYNEGMFIDYYDIINNNVKTRALVP